MARAAAGQSTPALSREGEASCRPFLYQGRETTADRCHAQCASSEGRTRSADPGSGANGVTSLSGPRRARTRSAASRMAQARALSARGVATSRRSREMFAMWLVSPRASVQSCRVHQRAWVASLDGVPRADPVWEPGDGSGV